MKVTHLRKKDVIKSSVKGIDIEFDHERLATILGVHSENGIREYIKEGEEPKKYDFFEDTFLTMCKLTREDGVWGIGSGENRRRDDAPKEKEEEEEERNKDDFDWEAVIDEATVEGESGSDDQFYDAQVGEEEPMMKLQQTKRSRLHLHSARRSRTTGVDPRVPLAEKSTFEISASLKERGQTDFMMTWRRPKSRMPNF
ncbi:hypothetical protein Dimus_005407 [Dionaea muscipula]